MNLFRRVWVEKPVHWANPIEEVEKKSILEKFDDGLRKTHDYSSEVVVSVALPIISRGIRVIDYMLRNRYERLEKEKPNADVQKEPSMLNKGVEKFCGGLEKTFNIVGDLAVFVSIPLVEASINTIDYALLTRKKISRKQELHLVDLESGLNELARNCDDNVYNVLHEFSDFISNKVSNIIFKKVGVRKFLIPLFDKIGFDKQKVIGIIKSNLISVLKNLLKSGLVDDIEYRGVSVLFREPHEAVAVSSLLGDLHDAFKKFFEPFAEKYALKTEGIKDAEYEVEKAQAKVLAFERLKEVNFLKRQSIGIDARAEMVEKLKDSDKKELLHFKEILLNLKNAIPEIIVEINKSDKSSEDKSAPIQDARETLAEVLGQIEAIEALLNEDFAQLNQFKREAILIEIQLNALTNFDLKDPEELKSARKKAQAELEEANKNLANQIESRKKIVIEEVAPQFLVVLFPEGAESLFIYQKHLSVVPAQNFIWSFIEKKFPIYFEQYMPFLFLLDAPAQEAILDKNPEAASLKEGINCLSDDLVDLVITKLLKVPESLRENLKEFLTPYVKHIATRLVNNNSRLDKNTFIHLIELISNIKPSYPTLEDLENPEVAVKKELESLFPNVSVEQSYPTLLEELQIPPESKPEEIKSVLSSYLRFLHEDKNAIIAQTAVEEIFKLFKIDNFENVGMPGGLAKLAKEKAKGYLASLIVDKLFLTEIHFRQMKVVEFENDAVAGTALKVSTLKAAIPAIISSQLDNLLNVNVRTNNGFSKIVNFISKRLGDKSKDLEKKSQFLNFLSNQIQRRNLNQLVEDGVGLIDTERPQMSSFNKDVAHRVKTRAIQLSTPLIVNKAVKALTPILEKEKNGRGEFDQTLLVEVLPILTQHLICLKNPSSNLIGVRPLSAIKKQLIYKYFSTRLLNVVLPKKAESLKEIFPYKSDLELNKDWKKYNTKLPCQLEQIKDSIFKKSILRDVLIQLCKSLIAFLKDTSVKPAEPLLVLTPAEVALQSQIEKELIKLAYQAARLTDLPVDKLLKIASYLPFHRKILNNLVRGICKAIQKKFNGKFIVDAIDKGLKGQINKVKKTEPTISEEDKDKQLDQLEKELIESLFAFGKRKINEELETAFKFLDYPVIKQVKNVFFALARFFISKVVGGFFRFFEVEKKLVNKSFEMLHRNRVNLQEGFAKPEIHEGVVLEMIQAGINVLERDWRGEPALVD